MRYKNFEEIAGDDGSVARVAVRSDFDHKSYSVSKYQNHRIVTPEGKFDSKKEYARWQELKLLQSAGKISELQRQVKFELVPKEFGFRAIYYVADFVYQENGKQVVEDSKGAIKTRLYMLKKRLMHWRHNIWIVET